MQSMFDTIIIGAGPTGLTAAMYAARRMMKTLVVSKDLGGQLMWAAEIKNYPGIKEVTGYELAQIMSRQVKDLGVEIKAEQVISIKKSADSSFRVETSKDNYESKTVIVAMGLAPKQLNLAKENEFVGRGISYCANCDGPFFKDKTVAVIGGGNSALDAAEVMSKIAKLVYLVYHKPKFKGFESLIAQVENKSNIIIMLDSDIIEIIGSQRLEKIKVKRLAEQTTQEVEVDGLFVEIGYAPKTELLTGLADRDSKEQIIVDSSGKTSLAGMFAAGDVTSSEFKQVVVGCGQGAVAALSAYKYLQEKEADVSH
ncbi:MAG: FAD-dependent oxidoreductase [bacterium]|nr:FAD-dependent oxidoreductase [bacterium]